ncbi:MAG: hypothetical protein ACYDCC_13445 [Actinomycetota bacterium]
MTRRLRIALIMLLIVPLFVDVPHAFAYATPAATSSIYEHDVSVSNLYSQGKHAGGAKRGGSIILDFGRPAQDSNGRFGMVDFGGHFDSMSDIEKAASAFADGYWGANRRNDVYIAIGSNDSCQPGGYCYSKRGKKVSCGRKAPYAPCKNVVSDFQKYGHSWGYWVTKLETYTSGAAPDYTDEVASGAIDAEPGWDPEYSQTQQTLTGFSNADVYNPPLSMQDYGSLDGGPCSGCSAWSAREQYEIAWGIGPDIPVPEIYYSSMAAQWAKLKQWAWHNANDPFHIYGVMTQHGANGSYSSSQAYNRLMQELERYGTPVTQSNYPIDWATDI